MLKHLEKIFAATSCAVLLGFAAVSCMPGRESTNVLAIWDMESDDPSAPVWGKELRKELQANGVRARIEQVYVPHSHAEEFDISQKLDMMEAEGNKVGLIIAGGDMNLHMLYDSPDERLKTLPAVSFGAMFPTARDRSEHINIGIIKDTIDIGHNLELMHILWPETRKVVTEIDWTQCRYESDLRDMVNNAVSRFGEDRIIDNVKLRFNESLLDRNLELHPEAWSMTALSLWDPWVNISTEKRSRIYPQYAFNPSISGNRVLFFKNDKTTRQMTEDKSFMAFCTAVPQQFEVCDSCAGGFLAPIDVTMRQVARMAGIMLAGNGEAIYTNLYLTKDYYLDWNVLRGKYRLEDIPGYVQIRNTNIKDRDPGTWWIILAIFTAATVAMAAILLYLISRQSRKSRSIKRAMLSSARESIRIKEEFDFIRTESQIHIWTIENDTMICEDPYSEICLTDLEKDLFDDFYWDKIVEFLSIDTPGKHQIQVYGTSPITHEKGWIELRMLIKETEHGLEKSGVSVSINDVKTAEAQLIETHRRLVNAQERDNFISSISHEMRTPLNSILGFSQVITDPTLETDADERMVMRNAVVNYGDELTNIINNILALTRIENGAVQMTQEICMVRNLIADICCEMELKAASSSIILEQNGGPEDSAIKADRLIFKIIVQNVIGNAIKFSEPGGHVSVSWEDHHDSVTVSVRDQGIGIDRNNQGLIFSRFFKVDPFSQGVGLGLSIAWEYITRMGGSITVESEPGKGSVFHLIFTKSGKEVKL